MAQPVWVLSVDLQTKTATFQSGMAEAARSARGAFTDIQSGGDELERHIGGNMFASRHAVMAVSEAFGDTMPRAITALLVHIEPLGAALEAAFPFAAIGLAAVLLIQHFEKLKEEGQKLTEDQINFGTAVQNAFNTLDKRLLEAGIRADELRNDHLGALAKQLQVIDMESMSDLVKSFGEVAKAAETVFGNMKSHWYTFGIGADGAKHALDDFQTHYDNLLAQGKAGEAADLLKGTRESAEKVLALQKEAATTKVTKGTGSDEAWAANMQYEKAIQALKASGVGITEKEIAAQQTLVQALQAQSTVEQKIADMKKLDDANATKATQNKIAEEAARKARENAEAEKRASEEAKRFYEEAYKGYVAVIDEGERNTIAATKEGSAARLAAIDQAIKEEQTEQLTGTAYYKELLTARVNLVRQMAEEESKLQSEAARETADNTQKMAELALAHDKEQQALNDSAHRVSLAQRLAEEIDAANKEYAIKLTAMSQQEAALDKGAKDYENKLKAIQDKEKQLIQEHENEITAIKDKATEAQNQAAQAGLAHLEDITAAGLTQVIMGHESFAKMMDSIGNQVVSGMIQNAIKSMMALDMTKEREAAAAARHAYVTGEAMGGPAGIVLGPVFAAAAFAGVMAFGAGTDMVPGVGRGDVVPAMLTPGEGVVPGGVMDGLRNMVRSGNMGGGNTHVMHYRPTFHVQTIDGDGVKGVLDKHSEQFSQHYQKEMRRMNR